MSEENSILPTQAADLQWPKLGDGLIAGVFILGAISLLCILLHLFYPAANKNPWLMTQGGNDLFSPSLVSVFTTHFFHGSNHHLWSNLSFIWPAGLIAFAIAGPARASAAIAYGIFFAGLAQFRFGEPGTFYVGSSSIAFALLGVIVLASIRKGIIMTVLMVVGIGFIGDLFFDTIRPTETTATQGISWLGHLGGLIGGFAADLRDRVEAIRVLYQSDTISETETEDLLRRANPTCYASEISEEPTQPDLEAKEET